MRATDPLLNLAACFAAAAVLLLALLVVAR